MVEQRIRLADAIAAAVAALAAAGVDQPRREALRLWTDLGNMTASAAVLEVDADVSTEMAERYLAWIERRASGEPLAYVTGRTGFRYLTLRCDRRALIPRPETEGLVDAALSRVRAGHAADIGTGTGAVALALASEGNFASVTATDVSADALALAEENARSTGLNLSFCRGDLIAPLAGKQFDLLVSNPPYLARAEHDVLDPSVRDYEPALALVSGDDGLDATRRILTDGVAIVAENGWIALEVDCRRAEVVGRMAAERGWAEVAVLDDVFGRARYVLARRGNRT